MKWVREFAAYWQSGAITALACGFALLMVWIGVNLALHLVLSAFADPWQAMTLDNDAEGYARWSAILWGPFVIGKVVKPAFARDQAISFRTPEGLEEAARLSREWEANDPLKRAVEEQRKKQAKAEASANLPERD